MNRLRVIPTWRHGQERLYVCRTDGRNVAWYDREAGRVNLLSEELRRVTRPPSRVYPVLIDIFQATRQTPHLYAVLLLQKK
ncbi:hypothetical protein PV382_44725, partial [Streptomyces scabiei]|nr:hypothetical protein [Streptomyces scabiei]